MLTVVQCLPALDHGGVERGTLEVAGALGAAGHRSMVVSAGGRLVTELVQGGSEHVNLPIGSKSLRSLGSIPALRRLLRSSQADILHVRSRLPAWIAYLAWLGMPPSRRPAFVTTVHGAYSVNRYSRIMTRGERVIAVSDFIRQYILENYPETDPARIVTIPRGVDPHVFPHQFQPDPVWLSEWRRRDFAGRPLITLPGRITRRKGLEDFIRIIHQLKQQGQPVQGLVAGGADDKNRPFYESLQQEVGSAGLQDAITFLGPRDDLREIMSISSIVLVLSKKPESFGRTALEALSLGTPVIAYDRGGSSEVLGNIFPQGLVKADDEAAATDRIRSFLQHPPAVPEQFRYTLQNMLDRTLSLYESLAGGGGVDR